MMYDGVADNMVDLMLSIKEDKDTSRKNISE